MTLVSLLKEDFCLLRSNLSSRDEILSLMFERMSARNIGVSQEEIAKAVAERDKLGSVVLGEGLAIPHARMAKLQQLQIGLCTLAKPITCDRQPISLLVLLLAPAGSSNLYLKTLAAFAKIMGDKRMLAKLMEAETFARLHEVLADVLVEPALAVRDIMRCDFLHLAPENTVKELLDAFYWDKRSYLPVLNGKGDFVGEVSGLQLLEAGIPGYVRMMENLRFLRTFEPLEDLLSRENEIKVRDIMAKPSCSISPDASIIELAFVMVQNKRVDLPVIDDHGKLCGTVSQMDLVAKVLRV